MEPLRESLENSPQRADGESVALADGLQAGIVSHTFGAHTEILAIGREVSDIGNLDAVAVENNQEFLEWLNKIKYCVHCLELLITFARRFR